MQEPIKSPKYSSGHADVKAATTGLRDWPD